MKNFRNILTEFHHINGDQIPLKNRTGSDGKSIFCPYCGKQFTYYKEGKNCRHCGEPILNFGDDKIKEVSPAEYPVEYKQPEIPAHDTELELDGTLHEGIEMNLSNVERMEQYFHLNPEIKAEELAQSMGITHDEADALVYGVMSSFLCQGKSRKTHVRFNARQLERGIKVEMEHTTCPMIAEKIAKDHLTEQENYYDHLDAMVEKFDKE